MSESPTDGGSSAKDNDGSPPVEQMEDIVLEREEFPELPQEPQEEEQEPESRPSDELEAAEAKEDGSMETKPAAFAVPVPGHEDDPPLPECAPEPEKEEVTVVPDAVPEKEDAPKPSPPMLNGHKESSDAKTPAPPAPTSTIPPALLRTTVIHSSDEKPAETFARLAAGMDDGSIERSTAVDTVFNVLVGGAFDLESRFTIVDAANIDRMLDLIGKQDPSVQAEVWSVFVAVVKKSIRNVEDEETATPMLADIFIQLVATLANYSITVKETKRYLRALKTHEGCWRKHSLRLVEVLVDLPKRDASEVFFSFPGYPQAGIFLPPLKSFPYQNGWTFSAWLRMDPANGVAFEKERPYIYCFRSAKGAEYSCHLMGNCLVLSAEKVKGKGQSRCVRSELKPRRWHHVVLSHNYARWGRSDVACYIDGHLADTVDLPWPIPVTDAWPTCVIGTCPSPDATNTSFTGQMGAVYIFTESTTLQQAHSLYCLGPGYQSALKHEAESDLPEMYKKYLFDGRLHHSILAVYSPKNCHGQLCLLTPPKSAAQYFVQIAHAVMREGVEVIRTHSLHSSLQSVGGIGVLLPLFDQLDAPLEGNGTIGFDLCATLLTVVTRLLESSPTFQQQFLHGRGLLVVAHALQEASPSHLSLEVVERIIGLARFLLQAPSGIPLLKHLFDYLLFNPRLWCAAEPAVQIHLYQYLSTDFMSNANFPLILRRIPTVIELCHSLKHYYYVVPPKPPSTWRAEPRNERLIVQQVIEIRMAILSIINGLITKGAIDPEGRPIESRDQEIHTLLNLVATVHENDNLYDILASLTKMLCTLPGLLIPALDRDHAIGMIFSLLASPSPLIRIPALKLLGYFLARSTAKRKNEAVGTFNALALLSDKLLLHTTHLKPSIYAVLFEMLTEKMTPSLTFTTHMPPANDARFENPTLLKVISQLICQSEETDELLIVKKTFLIDLITMCKENRDNRRTILQMSVWQEWLISLAYVFPANERQQELCELVYDLFSILLYHAIRHEYGGWRVWVDTLAIAHSKVSYENYRVEQASSGGRGSPSNGTAANGSPAREKEVAGAVRDVVDGVVAAEEGDDSAQRTESSPTPSASAAKEDRPTQPYRTPEFSWSKVHLRLLRDLVSSVEGVLEEWKTTAAPGVDPHNAMTDAINHNDNHVFVSNVVHVISQLADSLIMACGGLLPLLASATSPNSELEIKDTCGQELPIEAAADMLSRFSALADAFIFQSSVSLAELEQEKNMPTGGILREALRLIATSSVRHILACRDRPHPSTMDPRSSAKWDAITAFVKGALAARGREGLADTEHLMQEVDLNRIKGVVYRDMYQEETRQAQFLALAVIYLLSVLMVSRYRDILEPPASPSPFFNSTNDGKEGSEHSSPASAHHAAKEEGRVNGEAGSNGIDDGERDDGFITESEAGEESTTGGVEGEKEGEEGEEGEEARKGGDVAAIRVDHGEAATDENPHKAAELPRFAARTGSVSSAPPAERRAYLTTKLCTALESTAPILREIMTDFRSFLQKTLLGTHGQEIMNDTKVLETLKNKQGSVVELVMLLCSQEWQTSLQKHAGLAFIELVNEGRLMAHATRDHVLRVANEADFILNRLRAEDVAKHAQFEAHTADQTEERRTQETRMEHVIRSSRRRDSLVALRLLEKTRQVLEGPTGAWHEFGQNVDSDEFWRLDVWEDDSRRRLRFVPNPNGTRHLEARSIYADGGEQSADDKTATTEEEEARITKLVAPGRGAVVELVDESDIDKWATENDGAPPTENTSYSTSARLISQGVVVPGTLSITASDLYFDADEDDPLYSQQDPKSLRYCDNVHGRWQLVEIRAIFLRTHLLQNTALEMFLASRTAVMFAFADHETVRTVVGHLPRVGVGVKYGLPQSRKASLMTPRQLFRHSDMTERWQKREISNFDYLMFLNTVAGRSFNDLNQYPVFPWILTNYADERLDLSVASNFRDLSKPIGALSESRRRTFEERYNTWDDAEVPPFHYGTHYSTGAFTVNWMARVEPFTTFAVALQGGKFDCPDRIFHSLGETWARCQRDSHDVKELIPELFYLPEMLRNSNGLPLGKRADGAVVSDVVLPPWAKTPEQFVRIHRQALESDLVSCQLNQWIDLIFGYKQRGAEAVRACNVFHYLTYEGGVNLSSITDPVQLAAVQAQIASFGQTPLQLLAEAHPPRHSVMTVSPLMFGRTEEELCMAMKFVSNSPIVYLAANTFTQLPQPTVLSITNSLVYALNKWHNNYTGSQPRGSGNIALGEKEQEPAGGAEMPLSVDPLLMSASPSIPPPRRHLGEAMVHTLQVTSQNFVSTNDSRWIISCAYPDYSFRITETENGLTRQVVYGHGDVVTCIARSETSLYADCYVATGSLDCTVALWHWSGQLGRIAGEAEHPAEGATPRAILTGHDAPITALAVSAEHGLVISGCKDGAVVVHTTGGELLRRTALGATVRALAISRDCLILAQEGARSLVVYSNTLRVLDTAETPFNIECTAVTRDGEYLVTGSDNGIVALWRLFPLQQLYTYHRMDSCIRSVGVTMNQRFVLAGLDSGAIVVLNADFSRWHASK